MDEATASTRHSKCVHVCWERPEIEKPVSWPHPPAWKSVLTSWPHLHSNLQQITGAVWSSLKSILGLNDYRPVCGHKIIRETGVGPPEGHHRPPAGPPAGSRSMDDAVNIRLHYILRHLNSSVTYARVLFVELSIWRSTSRHPLYLHILNLDSRYYI